MAKVRKILKMVVEMDDDAGTMVELYRDDKRKLWAEGTFVLLSGRQQAITKKLFIAAEKMVSPTMPSPRGGKVVRKSGA